jgi:hypothetical protein
VIATSAAGASGGGGGVVLEPGDVVDVDDVGAVRLNVGVVPVSILAIDAGVDAVVVVSTC